MTGFFSRSAVATRRLFWLLYAASLAIAPWVFSDDASLSVLSQMGTMALFALSFNMLLGQGGMLSFGHAVYSGMGAFIAAHALNLAADDIIWMPVTLAPLAGGFAGALFAMLFGYLSTRRAGVAFSMITLGIAELMAACALMFPGFFGGEAGVTTNRVMGEPFLGIDYISQREVYYLIAGWLFISTVGMYGFTRTSLGRMLNAVRDNPERVEFIGYDPRWVRYLVLILSGFFAGISGALAAINFEIVTSENLNAMRSATVLLFTFIGGTAYFFGPILGAVAGVLLTLVAPAYTQAWQLYLGIFFIVTVLYAPGGMAGGIMALLQMVESGRLVRLWPNLWRTGFFVLLILAGFVAMVEMLYRITLDASSNAHLQLFSLSVDVTSLPAWLIAVGLLSVGLLGLRRMRKNLQQSRRVAKTEMLPILKENDA